ncbi:MAG: ATP-binding protein [Rhodospirillaceae bacterium]|jgi:signal transduction histidine kinase|nr:ATP-binding protein [Rhodospirillaceae bacterium]MBT6205781.1 ATP-binding protein [Rhodospirillaceae bacterium]MBT6510511.1 ATP-binding protein [Rhodospirillaceae bacterium]MBT7611784.1 ATP-binding protein [Rhodospirillaceae bacterium]
MAVTEMISVYGDRLDDDRKREELAMIAHDVDRLTALLENVVTLERSDSDMFNFEPEATDVGALCRRVADHALLLEKGQNAVNIAGDASLGRVNADPELLEHILSNVISNAVKYSPEHADIDVHLARNGEMLLIDVTDSGIGIPAKEMAQIGTPFYRASNTEPSGGTGLGFAIAMRAAHKHGGSIELESALGQGTRAHIRVRLAGDIVS